jgi:Flp pilus assembly protein TadG
MVLPRRQNSAEQRASAIGKPPCGRRAASVSLEMLLVMPVFLALLLGFVEFSSIVVVEERLAAASGQGARVASQGGTTTDVLTAVNNSLGTGSIQMNLMTPVITPADPTTATSGEPVTVQLQVSAAAVVPDLLRYIGYSISDQVLVGQTTMRKE